MMHYRISALQLLAGMAVFGCLLPPAHAQPHSPFDFQGETVNSASLWYENVLKLDVQDTGVRIDFNRRLLDLHGILSLDGSLTVLRVPGLQMEVLGTFTHLLPQTEIRANRIFLPAPNNGFTVSGDMLKHVFLQTSWYELHGGVRSTLYVTSTMDDQLHIFLFSTLRAIQQAENVRLKFDTFAQKMSFAIRPGFNDTRYQTKIVPNIDIGLKIEFMGVLNAAVE